MKTDSKKYHAIWMLLNFSGHLEKDYELWNTWCKCVASAIYLEDKFKKEVKESNKEVYKNLEGLHLWASGGKPEILKWCSTTYDVNHKLRFAVETLDSIEPIRVYLKNKSTDENIHLHNLLKMSKPTFTFCEV